MIGHRPVCLWMGLVIAGIGLCPAGCALAEVTGKDAAAAGQPQWYKGNTHTHSWWSDGDSPPEVVTAWYKEHGYHFLVMTDHGSIDDGDRWFVPNNAARQRAAARYEKAFGQPWVEKRPKGKETEYHLKTLDQIRQRFGETGRFLLITGEEITDACGDKPVHLCGISLRRPIKTQHGDTVAATIQNNVDAVVAQSRKLNTPMLVHINHPNYKWGITAEDLFLVKGTKFFEVQNGAGVRDAGDRLHTSTERVWDIVLAKRLGELGLPVMYGVGTDDAHRFVATKTSPVAGGRSWIMVRARSLEPGALIEAMNRGDFYASNGVTLKDVRFERNTLAIEIDPKPGVTYRTQFIGTLAGFNPTSQPADPKDPKAHLTGRYSPEIGKVLSEQSGTRVSYRLTGRELYVRAKVTAENRTATAPSAAGSRAAWVQPVQPER
ncbi:MAG TPA: hypothetical protein P5159_08265 [Phycisphaerae bacterium]|nr:hypothetical protein [Phycisphaerae bacterium]